MKKICILAAFIALPLLARGDDFPMPVVFAEPMLGDSDNPFATDREILFRLQAAMAMENLRAQAGLEVNVSDEVVDPPNFFVQRRGPASDAQMRNQIRTALQRQTDGTDISTWRDAAEERLIALGSSATSALEAELATRESYEADAITVALFRIENESIHPTNSLREWGVKRFPKPDPTTLKLTHIIDNRTAANMRELFPHHLFYVVEDPKDKTRAVVALAADGKVQPIEDDAALAKFLRSEGGPQEKEEAKSHLAAAAAILAAARMISPAKPDPHTKAVTITESSSTLDADGVATSVTLTFTPDSKLESVKTTQTGTPTPPSTAPTTAPILRGRRGGAVPQPIPAPPPDVIGE